jgi:glycosyltransferase involved in cell wall biosynthesis
VSRPLRAGVNAIFLEPGMGGLETYVLELTPTLLQADPALRLSVLCNPHGRELLAAQPWADEVELITPRIAVRGLRALYEMGPLGALAGRRFDVLHSPALTAPLATRAANVVVLADTTWITVPDLGKGQAATVRLWQAVVPRVARRADRVVAISATSARDVERLVGVPRERIDVVPLGYGTSQRVEPTPAYELRSRLGLGDGPIVLNVAMQKVHKNQRALVQALPLVRAAVPGAQLVLPGAETPYAQELRAEAARQGVGEAVVFPGYVDDADLEGLYAAASAFVFPSLNEGFGLPVLEAMGRGVPVVTSSVSSLPEVAGDAALLVDPTSVDEIAHATTRVLTEPALRERLIADGRRRTEAFTWAKAAEGTLASWGRALAQRSARRRAPAYPAVREAGRAARDPARHGDDPA